MERRVVNLLAAAYEEGLVSKGSEVELVVEPQEESGPSIRLRVAGQTAAVSLNVMNSQQLSSI